MPADHTSADDGFHNLTPLGHQSERAFHFTEIGALETGALKFRRAGAAVEVVGLNEARSTVMDRLVVHDKPAAMERVLGH